MLVIGKGAKFIHRKMVKRVKYIPCQCSQCRHVLRLIEIKHFKSRPESVQLELLIIIRSEDSSVTESEIVNYVTHVTL